ncbi:MAG: cation-transporting P-type ATPase [Acidobacteria bacterium]|nr:cation-transporting P-type ATPase [Acidobacteriota bacterium]
MSKAVADITVPQPSSSPTFWAGMRAEDAIQSLASARTGLAESEARIRLQQYGPNSLPHAARRPWYQELAANFIHLFALLLWVGAALAWVAGMPQLALAIVIVILINGLFSYWQEFQAERAAEALAALLPRQVLVRRDGVEKLIPAEQIVPGDILLLTEGEAIPADARIIAAERLRVDASSLTGESRPVARIADVVTAKERTAPTLPNLVFAGTSIASGKGEAVVFATGAATEFGRLAQLTSVQDERPSPLQQELKHVTNLVTKIALGFGLAFFIIGWSIAGLSLTTSFLFAIGIIVANVPEGLLPTLTLSLAAGVRRMARRNALVKRLSAVETLGATTVILTDKTGTLTENQMTVREIWADGISYQESDTGFIPADARSLFELLRAGALCCDAHLVVSSDANKPPQVIGDPTETAILLAAVKVGINGEALATWPRVAELPFDSVRKRMTTIQQINDELIACVKGAPNEIFPRCTSIRSQNANLPFTEAQRETVQSAHDALARRGLRVLAVATRKVATALQPGNGWRVEEVERELTLLGLLAMEDPPRPEVAGALAACQRAGIRAVMVTGDHGLTAEAIGREIGLYKNTLRVISGNELERLTDAELEEILTQPDVLFARATPEHKLRLVEAFQKRGEVVAVTGDGVNDAPALKRADIGVAMGVVGTDVAREAADMVLADDNFASIVAAIEEGRAVYDNIRKFVTYIFASNIPEAIPFIAFVLFHIPLPLTIMQILAVDLGTDLVPALALGMEAPEPNVMQRKPHSRQERLLNLPTFLRAYIWLGMIEAVLSLLAFFCAYWLAGWRPGMVMEESGTLYAIATTMTLTGIVTCQIGNAFACRSERQSIWRIGLTSNRILLAGIAVELLLILLLIYIAPLANIFGLAPLSWNHWVILAVFPFTLLLLEELRKVVAARLSRRA